ncbi:DUF4198 domain-containing protein [Azospirillum halopraeferens]|uniref:DUF4198 domain-containing protein n=1 Tax=Azospirillum halopraeferens TaxID=34010 RepID=UPI000421ABE3|nr:DUF4198 domain-containing protein [Azospirillum halopraeferens]
MKTLSIAIVALLAGTLSAQAHHIWIEQADGRDAVIRFGEFGENLREESPGLLDTFVKPAGTLVSATGERTADAGKAADGFTLPFRAANGDSIVAEDALYPLYAGKDGERTTANRYLPAARLITGFAELPPRLVLDLVPAGQPGQFKLFFNGQPRAKTKVTLVTQSGWSKEDYTDEAGLVSFDMPWKGTYVAEVSITDGSPGERTGANGPEAYDGVSYVTTATYVHAEGLEPIPAGPAAAAHK